jgi:hypothetical protein
MALLLINQNIFIKIINKYKQYKFHLHRDIFLVIEKSRKVPIKNVDDVLKLMKNHDVLRQMLPESNKILCIMYSYTRCHHVHLKDISCSWQN